MPLAANECRLGDSRCHVRPPLAEKNPRQERAPDGGFSCKFRTNRLLLDDLLLANVFIHPFEDQIGELKVVLVQHHHVAVALNA